MDLEIINKFIFIHPTLRSHILIHPYINKPISTTSNFISENELSWETSMESDWMSSKLKEEKETQIDKIFKV